MTYDELIALLEAVVESRGEMAAFAHCTAPKFEEAAVGRIRRAATI